MYYSRAIFSTEANLKHRPKLNDTILTQVGQNKKGNRLSTPKQKFSLIKEYLPTNKYKDIKDVSSYMPPQSQTDEATLFNT